MKNLRKKAMALWLSLISLALWPSNIALSQGQNQQAQSSTFQTGQDKQLKERFIFTKPQKTTVGEKVRADAIVVKFREGTRVRIQSERLAADAGSRSAAEQSLLRRADLDQTKVVRELAQFNDLLRQNPGISLGRMFTRPEETLDKEKHEAELISSEELADLNLYYYISLDSADPARAEQLIDKLNAFDTVEIAYSPPIPEPAQTDAQPQTDDFTDNQGYLDAAPGGIDARYAWTQPGGHGTGIRVIDVEQGWNLSHEDLGSVFFQDGVAEAGASGIAQHGTSVLGEIVGADNDYGITGIISQAAFGVSSSHRCSSSCRYSVAEAVNSAAGQLRRGDILLIEQHARGPASGVACDPNANPNCGQFEYIAMEYWQAEFDAIRSATARGIIVVEAAGNGSMNLDSAIYENRFKRTARDSGAIVIGAGISTTRAPHIWTNSGSRVDVQGWGDSVMTLGARCPVITTQCDGEGDTRVSGNDANQWYRNSFNGTSSASPIVVGAAGAVQGIRMARGLPLLDAFQMRALLHNTGTAQATDARQIGPLPNLRAAIDLIESPAATLVQNQSVTVRESDYDVNTGIDVRAGDRLVFSAGGEIWAGILFTGNNGPEGLDRIENSSNFPLPGSRPFSLLGKMSGSKYFFIGRNLERAQTEIGAPRRLYLRINDDVPGNGNGSFNCQVQVWRNLSNATFVSQNVPTSMSVGQNYNVSVTMYNSGASTWNPGYLYRLGSQSPQDNSTWGLGRIDVPGSVPPGATATFNFTVTAPSTPGTYTFQWRMLQEFVEWFGDYTPASTIIVNSLNRHLLLNVVSNSRTATTETITVYATDTVTGAPVTATVSASGAVVGQTGQRITYTHSIRVCEFDGELHKTICWYSPTGPTTFTVIVPGYDAASFTR